MDLAGVALVHAVREPEEALVHRAVRVQLAEQELGRVLLDLSAGDDDMRDTAGKPELLHEGVDDVDVVELVLFLKPVLPDHGDAVLDVRRAVIYVRVGRRVEMVAELL